MTEEEGLDIRICDDQLVLKRKCKSLSYARSYTFKEENGNEPVTTHFCSVGKVHIQEEKYF